jgi:hypothetical protein
MKDEKSMNAKPRNRPHKQLEVYRSAHSLGLQVHAITLKLPKFELYEEGSQSRRSSKTVSSQSLKVMRFVSTNQNTYTTSLGRMQALRRQSNTWNTY